MKRIISISLAAALALSLAACGAPASESAAPSEPASASESTAGTQEAADAGSDAADAESDLAYVQDKGTLVIGYTVYAPMNYTDENGEFTGFDTELATAVCEQIGRASCRERV